MQADDPDGMVVALEIHYRKVRDDAPEVEKLWFDAIGPACRVITNAAHHIDLAGDKGTRIMAGDKHRIGITDGITGVATHTQQGGFGFFIISDDGDIHLAILVHLHGRHHGVAITSTDNGEHLLVGHQAFNFRLVITPRTHRHRFTDQVGFAFGHHQARFKGQLGHGCCQPGHQADTGDHALAIAAEGFGSGANT